MNPGNFVKILLLTVALSAYSAWTLSVRSRGRAEIQPYASIPATDIPLIRLAEAEALWRQPSTVFLDVRSSGDYEVGHIAGAINLPEHEFEHLLPGLRPRLEKARAVVVYCKSTDCGQSLWSALRLRQEGLQQTMIYPNGWHEWLKHDLPSTRGGS